VAEEGEGPRMPKLGVPVNEGPGKSRPRIGSCKYGGRSVPESKAASLVRSVHRVFTYARSGVGLSRALAVSFSGERSRVRAPDRDRGCAAGGGERGRIGEKIRVLVRTYAAEFGLWSGQRAGLQV
jgi:hypothetical protein